MPKISIDQPMTLIERIASSNPVSFNMRPNRITGIVAIINNKAKRAPADVVSPVIRWKKPKNADFTSVQKYKITAPKVPMWTATSMN